MYSSPSLEVDFVLENINKLMKDHSISLQAETIIHSNQGCHYTSHKFINILYDKKLRQSISHQLVCLFLWALKMSCAHFWG